MARVLQCPHRINISGLQQGCMIGKFPADCINCDCKDKYWVDVKVVTSTTDTIDWKYENTSFSVPFEKIKMKNKMNIKELMIGDWVNVAIEGYDNPTQIKEIRSFSVKVTQDEKDYGSILIQPIPLTPEILEKNGFVTHRNIGYVLEDYNGNVIVYDFFEHKLKILVEYNVVFEQRYFDDIAVHQLQNILRLCEVEKEIEL